MEHCKGVATGGRYRDELVLGHEQRSKRQATLDPQVVQGRRWYGGHERASALAGKHPKFTIVSLAAGLSHPIGMANLSKTVKRVQPSTTFSKRLRQARERAGLTQTELGLRVGMDPSAASPRMNQYEKGIHEPPHAMVKRLAEELGVPAAFLFVDDDRLADLLLLWTELGDEGHEKLLRYAKRQVKAQE